MTDDTTLAAISFPDAFRAFLTAMNRLTSQGHLFVQDAVFVNKDNDGNTTVQEITDLETGGTALNTGLWSGLHRRGTTPQRARSVRRRPVRGREPARTRLRSALRADVRDADA